MKTRKLILILLSFAILPACEKDKEQPESSIANAKLSQVKLYSYPDEKFISIVAEYEYDGSGKISRINHPQYDNGEVSGIIYYDLYEYNAEGLLTRISRYNANLNSPDGYINTERFIYTYNLDGSKAKELIEYPVIGDFEYSLFTYVNGKLVRTEEYDDQDALLRYSRYEYGTGNLNQPLKVTRYDSSHEVISVVCYTYQNGLNVKEEVISGTTSEPVRMITKNFDSEGNLIKLSSHELSPYSSLMSFILKYSYLKE